MDLLIQDVRYAIRTLRRNRWYAVAVISTLALGIGANTAMFSVLRGVLLAPLPQSNAERVVRLFQPNTTSAGTGLSPQEMRDYAAAPSIESIVEYHSMPFTFIGAEEPERLQTGVVSADYFDVLGVPALLGRTFRPGEDQPGSDPVLVLSWEYWQRAFGGDPDVVGATFRMNDRTHSVVGVLPRIPQYPDENDVYMPASSCPFRSAPSWAENRTMRQPAFALLVPGTTMDAALADLRVVAGRLHETWPDAYPTDLRFTVSAEPLAELMTARARPSILMLLAATTFLLLLVCANVVNLAVVRMVRREPELATRLALGADRPRLVRQLVTESALLGVCGGALGLLVATGLLAVVAPFLGQFTPRAWEIRLDPAVLAFTATVSMVVGIAAGALPALTRLRAASAFGARATAGLRQMRLRNGLIVVQVAVSLVLLVCAGLMMRSLDNARRVQPGFDPARVLTARLDLNWTRYDTAERSAAFMRALEERLESMGGIDRVAFGLSFPLNGDPANAMTVVVDGVDPSPVPHRVAINAVSTGYFDVLGVPVLRGRGFEESDALPGTEPVLVATREAARRLWGDADPVGRRVSLDGGGNWGTIVGVVGDVRQQIEDEHEAMLFVHRYRFQNTSTRLLVRGGAPAAAVERWIRAAVAELDREQPVTDVRTIEEFRQAALAPRRIATVLLGSFALLALIITAVGLGGLIAYSVAERVREIGIRMALGAGPMRVVGMVLRQAVGLTLVGVLAGAGLATIAARSMAALLFGVPPADPVTFAGVALLLVAVAMLAVLAPARRATRIDPARALREA